MGIRDDRWKVEPSCRGAIVGTATQRRYNEEREIREVLLIARVSYQGSQALPGETPGERENLRAYAARHVKVQK